MARTRTIGLSLLLLAAPTLASAAEHVTLTNGREFDCIRRESDGIQVRLYLSAQNYVVVPADNVLRVDPAPDPVPAPSQSEPTGPPQSSLQQLMTQAGAAHRIDVDLLASVIQAESGGRVTAVSRVGAQGLMQLMPGTASTLGVTNAFAPDQNIAGGTAFLDQLLVRYHDDVKLALAAYNAGPGAVDKYHGVPPFRETRAYVTRVITEFNRRKRALLASKSNSANTNKLLVADK